ncbi:MAG: hypothetical protein IJU70_05320 [Lentisphaeria bacterium]|nr:hypothetical protein [Lentisphaeria bacterium]
MSNNIIRTLMFLAAMLLTLAIPALVTEKLSSSNWVGIIFLIPAEALLFLPAIFIKDKNFPLRVPLFLWVFPGYFILTLALALCSGLLAWRILLTVELVLTFLIFISVCISLLAGNSEETPR